MLEQQNPQNQRRVTLDLDEFAEGEPEFVACNKCKHLATSRHLDYKCRNAECFTAGKFNPIEGKMARIRRWNYDHSCMNGNGDCELFEAKEEPPF